MYLFHLQVKLLASLKRTDLIQLFRGDIANKGSFLSNYLALLIEERDQSLRKILRVIPKFLRREGTAGSTGSQGHAVNRPVIRRRYK